MQNLSDLSGVADSRVQRVRQAVPSPGKARAEWQTVCALAKRMGATGFDFQHPREIMSEIADLVSTYGGISHERLEEGGLQWPCPDPGHPGTLVLHVERFSRGMGKFIPVSYTPPADRPDKAYPFVLTTVRSAYQFHSGTLSRKVAGLNLLYGQEEVEMNEADALALGIRHGDKVRVKSPRGSIVARVAIDQRVSKGMVSATFHFAETLTNALTSPARDPASKIAELKVCAVNIEKV